MRCSGWTPRKHRRDFICQLAWEHLSVSLDELEEVAGTREVLASLPHQLSYLTFELCFIFIFFLQLANTEEYVDGALAGHLGEVLIRYVNDTL